MQTVNLNLIPGSVTPVINLSQFDEGRQFALAIYDGSTAADLSTAQILISGKKNDETAFSYGQSDTVKGNYVIAVNNNVVTIRNTLQMAAVAGEVIATLTIKKSESDVSTLNFLIFVQESPIAGVDISDTEIPGIIALAQAQADEAEAWATGEIDGVPVPSDAPQYENSAEYWAGISEQYAQGGLKWKGDCTFAQIPTTGMAVGDMWNITDAFTTDARFKEGAGISVKAGTNIAWDGTYWDLLSTGAPVALPTGGIAGQTIVKRSSTDGDAEWGQGIYFFSTLAAAQAAVTGGTVPNGATVMVDEIGGNGVLPAISNLNDVQLTSLADGQMLRYDQASGKWKNKAIDSAISTGSTNPVQNSTIAAALANGRISFAVDGNGNWGYKKDGADTVYPFSSIQRTVLCERTYTTGESWSGGTLNFDEAMPDSVPGYSDYVWIVAKYDEYGVRNHESIIRSFDITEGAYITEYLSGIEKGYVRFVSIPSAGRTYMYVGECVYFDNPGTIDNKKLVITHVEHLRIKW